MRDAEGKLWSYQIIKAEKDASGMDKYMKESGKAQGCMHVLGKPNDDRIILVAEGYATAASLHMATQKPTVVAFSAHNLNAVVEALRHKYPDHQIYICADQDKNQVGIKQAEQAAFKHQARVILPPLEAGQVTRDFNDLHVQKGLHAVQKTIEDRLVQDQHIDLIRGLIQNSMRDQSQEIQDEVLKLFDDKVRTEGLPEIPKIQIKEAQEKEYER